MSKVEREELLRLVDEEFEEKTKEKDEEEDDSEEEEEDDEDDECVLKGKSTSLSAYFRVARNMMSMVFKDKFEGNLVNEQPELRDVEDEYWRLVQERDCHMQVSDIFRFDDFSFEFFNFYEKIIFRSNIQTYKKCSHFT